MRNARKTQAKHRPPLPTADSAAGWQQLVAVGVVQHPTSGQYQVWLHARGQTAMLLAYRTMEQADAAKNALGQALVRGEYATPERWCATVAAIGADTDAPLEPVSEAVFAAITASIQGAGLRALDMSLQAAGTRADDPEALP
jgi:hypothetical protein